MMVFRPLLKQTERFITDNSPAILTGIGVAGVVATAYLTGQASIKAARLIDETETFERRGLELKEKVELVWTLYIPPVTTGLLTVTCIIAANRIGNRRAAAIAAAYSLTERAFEEYRNKVVEKIGERKEELVRADIVQDRLNENPPPSREVLMIGPGDVLCMEGLTGRYFNSNVETLRGAENQINACIIHDMYASLSDFYDLIGLQHTDISDEMGWNVDKMLDLHFASAIAPDGRPCISFSFRVVPIRNYTDLS
jgi:hypothetical protein